MGEYNLLILPSSFPYGGMENPTLTFVTPSILAGDKSLADVVVHEICHSWSGNLITMDSWSDYWLNEGFTMFLQRKVIEQVRDIDLAKLDAKYNYNILGTDIKKNGPSKSFTALRPYLVGRHPDDSFSHVPYEKGFNFIYYLESVVKKANETGTDIFRKMLRGYFSTYKYKSINYQHFKQFFIDTINTEFPEEKAKEIFDQIDWETWLNAPGFPPVENDFSNKYSIEVEEATNQFYNNTLPETFVDTFKNWYTLLKIYFLNIIRETDKQLDDTQLNWLNVKLNLKEGYNAEISFAYFISVLTHGKDFEDSIKQALIQFLGTIGRMKFIRPLYSAFYQKDKETALATFEKYKSTYHPIAVRLIELDFKKLS